MILHEVANVGLWRFHVLKDFLVLLSVEASHSIYLHMEHGVDFDDPFSFAFPIFCEGMCSLREWNEDAVACALVWGGGC